MKDENLENLEQEIRRELGDKKFEEMMELERQIEKAIGKADFPKAHELDRKMQLLIDPRADASKPSPAAQLTKFFESLIKAPLSMPDCKEELRRLEKVIPETARIISKIFFGSLDQFEREANDSKMISENMQYFDEKAVFTLLDEAKIAARHGNISFAERIYEITEHVLRIRNDYERQKTVSFEAAVLCEMLGRYVSAMDWYDIARSASEELNDNQSYIRATIGFAKAGMKYAPEGLDWQILPMLEEIFPLSKQYVDSSTRKDIINLLIQLYERKGDKQRASELRAELNR